MAAQSIRSNGPTEALLGVFGSQGPDLTDAMLPYLKSDDPVLLRGAIAGLSRPPVDQKVENGLLAAAEHVAIAADRQTVTNYAATLGTIQGDRARNILWSFVERGIALDQSLIALAWHKDPRDLGRLGALL